jgi:mitochondrial fission protein ELM1
MRVPLSKLPTPSVAPPDVVVPAARGLRIWVVTDGKAGDEIPCIGVAEELLGVRGSTFVGTGAPPMDPRTRYPLTPPVLTYATGSIEIRRVAPRRPWVWLMPRGPIDPRDRPYRPGSPIAPPWPDILIASGRRSIAYVRAVKRMAGTTTFAVILKDPRTRGHGADFVWVPEHDRSKDRTFMRTLTTPHRFSPARIATVRMALPATITNLPGPRVGLLLGGRTRVGPFSALDRTRLCDMLAALKSRAGSFLITVSRRTPPDLLTAVRDAIGTTPCFIWDNVGPNPYLDILAGSDVIVATGDSHTMISEAAAAGTPLLIFAPHCVKQKLTYFGLRMVEEGWAKPFVGQLADMTLEPHDSTPLVAADIWRRFSQHRKVQGAGLVDCGGNLTHLLIRRSR